MEQAIKANKLVQDILCDRKWMDVLWRHVHFYGYQMAVKEVFRKRLRKRTKEGHPYSKEGLLAALLLVFSDRTSSLYRKVGVELQKNPMLLDTTKDPYSKEYRDELHAFAADMGTSEYVVLEVLDNFCLRRH